MPAGLNSQARFKYRPESPNTFLSFPQRSICLVKSPGKYTFTKGERILKPGDFLKTRKGKRYSTKSFVVHISPNDKGITRLGLSVSAKAGNSVRRNRIKRLIREFFRLNKTSFPESADILISVRQETQIAGYDDVCRELAHLFK